MGKTELFLIIIAIIVISVFLVLYSESSKKIKSEKKQSEKPAEKKEEKKQEYNLTSEDIKPIFEEVSNASENYIKNMALKEEIKNQHVQFEEVSAEELFDEKLQIDSMKDSPIYSHTNKVYVMDEQEDELSTDSNSETASLISADLDTTQEEIVSYNTGIKVENFIEDDHVGEEFKNLSNTMKILMMSNVLNKKYEDENFNNNINLNNVDINIDNQDN